MTSVRKTERIIWSWSCLNGEGTPISLAMTQAEEFPLGFSPDGRWMLYQSNAPGRSELYAISFPDLQRRQQISAGGSDAALWKGQNEIWYQRPGSTWVSVQWKERSGTLELSDPRPLFRDERLTGLRAPAGSDRLLGMRLIGEVERPETVLVNHWKRLLDVRPSD